jgi:hypothetical protein
MTNMKHQMAMVCHVNTDIFEQADFYLMLDAHFCDHICERRCLYVHLYVHVNGCPRILMI